MTNEEIKAQLDQVQEFLNQLKAELAGNATPAPAPAASGVIEGPNEWGAVKLAKVEAVKPNTWVLWPPTLKETHLSDQARNTICANVGCDADGNLGAAFGMFRPASQKPGNPAAKVCSPCYPSVFKKRVNLPFIVPTWNLDMANALPDTISARTSSEDEVALALQTIRDGKN